MTLRTLVYVHIGSSLPDFLHDSIYQALIVNQGTPFQVVVLLEDSLVNRFQQQAQNYDYELYGTLPCHPRVVPLSTLKSPTIEHYLDHIKALNCPSLATFRDGFWISTTLRFFYIDTWIAQEQLNDVYHIENDIMLYQSLEAIDRDLSVQLIQLVPPDQLNQRSNLFVVKDAPNRVIPAIIYIPRPECLHRFCEAALTLLKSSPSFANDMDLLGRYPDVTCLNLEPTPEGAKVSRLVYDGAALGQYLGGVDVRNLGRPPEDLQLLTYQNPSKGFVNETCRVKPDQLSFGSCHQTPTGSRFPLKKPTVNQQLIVNLHIHGKLLAPFSSIFTYKFEDLISGERFWKLCDYVMVTREIFLFHHTLPQIIPSNKILLLDTYDNINFPQLNRILGQQPITKLGLYTHMLQPFMTRVLPHLNGPKLILYVHNSDHAFDQQYEPLLDSPQVIHIYAQNIDYPHITPKLSLLPIGFANSMWPHGNLLEAYQVMIQHYFQQKTKNIYININPQTYSYRQVVLDQVKRDPSHVISGSKPYPKYLEELSQHYFCLCLRGNGLDTHRFWEALYLGVIPVILNNPATQMSSFIAYLRQLNVPFYEETEQIHSADFYNRELYLQHWSQSPFTLPALMLGETYGSPHSPPPSN